MKRKFIHIIFIGCLFFLGEHITNAQHSLVNTNVKFNVAPGVFVRVPGDVVNNSSSVLNNDGNIFLSGDFINNANVVSGNGSNISV